MSAVYIGVEGVAVIKAKYGRECLFIDGSALKSKVWGIELRIVYVVHIFIKILKTCKSIMGVI